MKYDKSCYNQFDFEAIKILEDFLPDKIFDSHAHFYDRVFAPAVAEQYGAEKCDSEDYRNFFAPIFEEKQVNLNIFAYPDKAMLDNSGEGMKKSDELLLNELEKDSSNVGEIIVFPEESVEQLEKRLVHPNIKGFKCYHVFNKKEITWNCDIWEYLPESAWQIANEKKMCITLHMVKDAALSDEKNLKYICEMAQKYKDATLILAHAARSFAAWTAIESVEKVKHLENVWFDFSGVCESPAMFQIMRKAGVGRCMWGSDFPVCAPRGKGISLANAFYWIYQRDIDNFDSKTVLKSWLIATENLMATRQACILAELSPRETEDLFYNNAARLFYNK